MQLAADGALRVMVGRGERGKADLQLTSAVRGWLTLSLPLPPPPIRLFSNFSEQIASFT